MCQTLARVGSLTADAETKNVKTSYLLRKLLNQGGLLNIYRSKLIVSIYSTQKTRKNVNQNRKEIIHLQATIFLKIIFKFS